jgi:Putative peptidoglycan binding domain
MRWGSFLTFEVNLGLAKLASAKIATACGTVFFAGSLLLAQTATSTTPAPADKPMHKHASAASATPPAKAAGKSTKPAAALERSSSKGVRTRRSRRATASRQKGQQKIDSSRTQEIQQALIREHFLSGSPSGNFDDATQQALRRYQAANGWQNKTVPDARALIKLGLGPDHEHLLNPESAMTMPAQPPRNVQYSNQPSETNPRDKIQQ